MIGHGEEAAVEVGILAGLDDCSFLVSRAAPSSFDQALLPQMLKEGAARKFAIKEGAIKGNVIKEGALDGCAIKEVAIKEVAIKEDVNDKGASD